MRTPDHKSVFRPRLRAAALSSLILLPMLLGCGILDTPVPPTVTPTASFTPSPVPTQTLTPTPTPTLTPAPTRISTRCGGPPAMFILLVGSDARVNSYEIGLADAIRLVRVDFVNPRVQVLTFQRDLYVEIPGIEDHNGITHGKLNQAFLYGNPGYGYYDGPGQGPGLLAQTLEHNFNATSDHYMAVNLQIFAGFIDSLGGIDIRLPYVVDGRVEGSKDPDRYFPKGYQQLNGYRTMLLARMRPRGDFDRSEIQDLILQAVVEKLLQPSRLPGLFKFAETFRDSVQTDLSPIQTGQLICLASIVEADDIEFLHFPESLFKSARVNDPVLGNTSILAADFEVLKPYVQRFVEGNWADLGE